MLHTFKVRAAQSSDADRLFPLWLDLYRFHIKELGCSLNKDEVRSHLGNYLVHPQALQFVAESEGKLVGFVAGELTTLQSPLQANVSVGSIDHWYVVPEQRDAGVGKALLERIESAFSDLGVKRVNVEVWNFNNNALERYLEMGYRAHIQVLEKKLD